MTGIYVGDVKIPFVTIFTAAKLQKKSEVIPHLGNIPPHVAEFPQSDTLMASISGTLFSISGDVRSVDQYAEDLTALVDRSGVYNYINNYQNRSGWLVLDDADAPKSAESVLIRRYSLSGRFLSKAKYQARMNTAPAITPNDFSFVFGSGGFDSYIPLPIGAVYNGGDGSSITRVGKDGTITLIKGNTSKDIKWDLAADEVDKGECKVWDTITPGNITESTWVRVFSPDHKFTGDLIAENGLVRIRFYVQVDRKYFGMKYYSSSLAAYTAESQVCIQDIGSATKYCYGYNIVSITPDKIIVQMLVTDESFKTFCEISRGHRHFLKYPPGFSGSRGDNATAYSQGRFGYLHTTTPTVRDSMFNSDSPLLTIANATDNWGFVFKETDTVLYGATVPKANTFNDVAKLYYHPTLQTYYLLGYTQGDYPTIPFYVNMEASKLFKECEAMTQGVGVTFYTGADASPKTGNTGSTLNAQNEYVEYTLTPADIGHTDVGTSTYRLFVRAKDSAQVAGDLGIYVTNTTDASGKITPNPTPKTLTASWAYYYVDVTLGTTDEVTDTITVKLNKETVTANSIDVDYILWIPITLDSKNGPQDIAHQAMVNQNLKRELIAR